MLGSTTLVVLVFLGVLYLIIDNLPTYFRQLEWTDKDRVKCGAKKSSMSPWCFMVAAYVKARGEARARLDVDTIRIAFSDYQTLDEEKYEAPPWLSIYAIETIDPVLLKKSDRKLFSRSERDIHANFLEMVRTDETVRGLAKELWYVHENKKYQQN